MQCVYFCFLWQCMFLNQRLRQVLNFLRNLEQRKITDDRKPTLRGFRVL